MACTLHCQGRDIAVTQISLSQHPKDSKGHARDTKGIALLGQVASVVLCTAAVLSGVTFAWAQLIFYCMPSMLQDDCLEGYYGCRAYTCRGELQPRCGFCLVLFSCFKLYQTERRLLVEATAALWILGCMQLVGSSIRTLWFRRKVFGVQFSVGICAAAVGQRATSYRRWV